MRGDPWMEEQKTLPSIGQLNETFMKEQGGKKEPKKPRHFKWLGILLVLLIGVGLYWRLRPADDQEAGTATEEPSVNESVFTAAELERWGDTEGDETVVPLQYNQEIEVRNRRAFTRIVNPIYSSYSVSVKLITENQAPFYQSEKLAPGTILEAVTLSRELPAEEIDATIEYTVYDREDNIIGTYPVTVKLTQK